MWECQAKRPSMSLANTVAMVQVFPEDPVDLCSLRRGWWPQFSAMDTLKRLKWLVSPMRLLQTAFTPLARQGKWSHLVLSKITQFSQTFTGMGLWATKSSSGCRSSSSQRNKQVLPLLFHPPLGTLKLSSSCPPLIHHSPFGWRNERNRHRSIFNFCSLHSVSTRAEFFYDYFIIGIWLHGSSAFCGWNMTLTSCVLPTVPLGAWNTSVTMSKAGLLFSRDLSSSQRKHKITNYKILWRRKWEKI